METTTRDAQTAAPPRRALLIAAKLAVSALLVSWILHRAGLGEVWQACRTADPFFLFLSFCLFPLGWLVSVARWRLLMRALGGESDYGLVMRSFLVGIFFNNLLPGTMGGDAVRVYQTARSGLSGARAVAVIVVDRFLGLTALLLFAAVALGAEESAVRRSPSLPYWIGGGVAVALLSSWLLFTPSPRVAALLARLRAAVPERFRGLFDRVFDALFAFQGRYGVLGKGFLLSIGVQALVVANAICLTSALHIRVAPINYFFMVPLALFAMMAPVSINGVGVRESVWVFFLVPFGVAASTAVAYAWLDYGMILVQALIGWAVYAFSYRPWKAGAAAAAHAANPTHAGKAAVVSEGAVS
ncbi:MAG TPA: lysylphosphatidylglycerol synthase transmembrane domain-containing protein [Thermoanaerobaculia bacterium]|nr:lysylphosphatidylglycerol synthase transmembrane domain-containing protein [Thermoanaerobaculia bacterium]